MPLFEYVVKDLSGEESAGVETAPTVDTMVETLHRRGLIVLSIEERSETTGGGFKLQLSALPLAALGGVSVRTLALFTRQLSTMLQAGLPLVRGLTSLTRDEKSKYFRRVLEDVTTALQNGASFSEALCRHPRVFNELYTSMVRAGERSGRLDMVLDQLGEYLEKADAVRTKVKSAMAYPGFVGLFSVGAIAFLLLKVIPTFSQIYANFHSQLPAPTMFVLNISEWARAHMLITFAILVLGGVGFTMWKRTERGAYLFDAFVLRLPIFGPLTLKASMSRFTRTLSALLSSGLPMLEALQLVQGACGNRVVARAVAAARIRISTGQDLGESFAVEKVIPQMVLQLMTTGQETGALDDMLARAAHFCDVQVDAGVAGLSSLLEPVMIVTMGGLVGGLVITMFLPVFNMGKAMGG
jgi:type IV pilus assembly protein PilC